MVQSTSSPVVTLATSAVAEVESDLVILPMFEGESVVNAVPGLSDATGGAIERGLASKEIQGKPYELFLTPVVRGWRAERVALVGAGPASDFTLERLRRLATAAALAARQRRVTRIAFVHRLPAAAADAVQVITEGLTLALFTGDRYKSQDKSCPAPERMLVVVADAGSSVAALERAIDRGRVLGESSNLARDLCNEPANILTPSVFAERGAALARSAGLSVEVLDEDEIERLQMGLLLGVSRGSAEPPRVIVMTHDPAGAPTSPVLGLVGKGITFDTGGISIKPAEGMDRMKDDMAGGAAVIGAMRAISLLQAPIKVIGIVPASENMPGGRATKPGDVLTGAGGKTVEVLNTDAEGRLILGDGLWYAQRLGATHLVDVATLTGACVVALGKVASGLFGRPDAWIDAVRRASVRAGDRAWPLPIYDEYTEQLRSEIADLVNTGGRPAGACTAAVFLKEFAGSLPWAHLDIAGTAWADEPKPWQPKGPTGVAVRTLAELAFSSGEWA
ncbi:MAG: leucyl aminopeptidase [Vicinamibacterales bacterium]